MCLYQQCVPAVSLLELLAVVMYISWVICSTVWSEGTDESCSVASIAALIFMALGA